MYSRRGIPASRSLRRGCGAADRAPSFPDTSKRPKRGRMIMRTYSRHGLSCSRHSSAGAAAPSAAAGSDRRGGQNAFLILVATSASESSMKMAELGSLFDIFAWPCWPRRRTVRRHDVPARAQTGAISAFSCQKHSFCSALLRFHPSVGSRPHQVALHEEQAGAVIAGYPVAAMAHLARQRLTVMDALHALTAGEVLGLPNQVP